MEEDHYRAGKIAALYDHISRVNLWINRLKYGNRYAALNMHKRLLNPDRQHAKSRGLKPCDDINDLTFELIQLPPQPRVLDVGCGFGATIFRWYEKCAGRYDGFTLSPLQVTTARRLADEKGIGESCRFFLRNFEHPIPGRYHAIIALEALIHGRELSGIISRLCDALEKGGYLVIVDDVAIKPAIEQDTRWRTLKNNWHLTTVPSRQNYQTAFLDNGLHLLHAIDLTSRVLLLNRRTLQITAGILHLLKFLIPHPLWRGYFSAHLGGLALQQLYRHRYLSYMVYVAQKS